MGTKTVEPRTIRNVTLVGDPRGTVEVADRLLRYADHTATVRWATDQIENTIRFAEVSSDADPERSIRVADAVIAIIDAAAGSTPRLEAMLRAVDDHQVARLCLITGLDRPGADFDRCVGTIADIRGAVPVPLQIPVGPPFDGVIDLVEPTPADISGTGWQIAERWHRKLLETVTDQGTAAISAEQLHHRIRHLTRLGDIVPILCGADNIAPLLHAIVRYLPSPMDVCQPEHALDY